jgi:hypothetical protein
MRSAASALAFAPDAAMALGIASTAMPFAPTPEAEAERWLRILRLHGESGIVLRALGVSEGRLEAPLAGKDPERAAPDRVEDTVRQVVDSAIRIARGRGAPSITTTDLLPAVMDVYGAAFDRVLLAHGTDRDEVTERLLEVRAA